MSRPGACLLSFSRIADDPRVRRQGDALAAAGWDVTGVGLAGAHSPAPTWPVVQRVDDPVPADGARRAAFIGALARVRLLPSQALDVYWRLPAVRQMWSEVARIPADVYLANDWWTLPLAQRAAQHAGGAFAYDSHEHAISQGAIRWRWRMLFPPFVRAVEGSCIGGAAFVSSVCRGIAELLQAQYRLQATPLVVRSTPPWQAPGEHITSERVRVLYHGLMRQGRGLEAMVQALAGWPEGWTLSLRGPAREGYLESLRRVARAGSVEHRLELLPPVPMTELVAAARPFDVGVFCADGPSSQSRFVLPNKLFEYIMAGLAVCVSDLPEMARVVREHRVGWLVPEATPEAITRTLAALTPSDVHRAREASRAAAKTLCWEVEQRTLLEAMARAVGRDAEHGSAPTRRGAASG